MSEELDDNGPFTLDWYGRIMKHLRQRVVPRDKPFELGEARLDQLKIVVFNSNIEERACVARGRGTVRHKCLVAY